MGCGASRTAAISSNTTHGAAQPVKSILVNGTTSRRRHDSDNVSQTHSIVSVSREPMQLQRQLSSVNETDGHARHAAVQTDLDSVFGIKTQYVQTDQHELHPEDELELLISECVGHDDDNNDGNISPCTAERVREPRAENSSYSRHKMHPTADDAHKEYFSVGIQVLRTRSCFTQTKTLAYMESLKSLATSSSGKMTQPRTSRPRDPRLWTAPSKPSDIRLSPAQHDFESQTDPLSQALAANAADSADLNVLHSYEISSPFSHIEKELQASGEPRAKSKRNFDIRLQECLNKLLDDMEESYGAQPRAGE